ncbi:hypothetical protein M513_13165 [Trichuris suis]|uniref:Uncharacterized protein n=1 Tax=Trichuris suis TaxID=68888 RepID=A0A085LLW2_9BILA|nr:hypothetical protein M513_13165 [Trichuris suis]
MHSSAKKKCRQYVEESPRGSVSAGRTSGCSLEAFIRAFVRGIIYKNYAGYENEQHTDQPFLPVCNTPP